MSLSGGRLGWVTKKARDLLEVEREALLLSGLPLSERVRFVAARYRAVIQNQRVFSYVGNQFHYDNRLLPLLMPAYLTDIERLSRITRLSAQPSLVDIGANVGQFATTFKWKFPDARIWSFEPNHAVMPLLDANSATSESWHVVPWGVAECDQSAELWSVDGKSGQASVYRDNAQLGLRGASPHAETVCLRRLSRGRLIELGIPGSVDVVKVDVEGAEEAVLKGIADLRWRFLVIETSLHRRGGLTIAETVDLVESLWAVRPRVLWHAEQAPSAATADLILELPSSAKPQQ
jgi:FkbM family methyltransferase